MDNREEWKRYLSAFKDEMMWELKDPVTKKNVWWIIKYEETKYETPKTFRTPFAFNDGSWLRFPREYRTKSGKPRGIYLKDTKSVVMELAFFCRFQWLLGVRLRDELVYHMVCFLSDVVKVHSGAFECNQKSKDILYKIADDVLKSEVKEETLDRLKDKRAFCIAHEKLVQLDESSKISMQAKGKRMSNYFKILKKYDEQKSISQNAVLCEVSTSTIKRFKKYRSEIEHYYKEYFSE